MSLGVSLQIKSTLSSLKNGTAAIKISYLLYIQNKRNTYVHAKTITTSKQPSNVLALDLEIMAVL